MSPCTVPKDYRVVGDLLAGGDDGVCGKDAVLADDGPPPYLAAHSNDTPVTDTRPTGLDDSSGLDGNVGPESDAPFRTVHPCTVAQSCTLIDNASPANIDGANSRVEAGAGRDD